ncbi:alpha-xylosidase [Diplocarpon rosae]|nr:alpha-xylosidase [Diplocarpon rosae]
MTLSGSSAARQKYFTASRSEDELEIITDHFHLSYDKQRFSSSGLMASFNAKITLWGAQWRFGNDVDGRCDMGEGVISRSGYAEIDDSKSMLFDGHGFVAGRRSGDRVDGYLFAYGHDYRGAIRALYQISGQQPSVPRYALGNWWSRYYAYSQEEYVALMDKFREKGVPLSVAVIDMDWHMVSDDAVPHAGWTGYTWDKKLFPDPKAFGKDLHDRRLKITLNDHPHAGIHYHEDGYEEMAAFLRHDTTHKHPILFDPTNPRFMEAYLKILHRNIEDVACDFWWIDWQQGEHSKVPGLDPLWMLNHFHFLDSGRGGNQPLIFSRYAGPGSHRYPVGFSGDTITTWASLEFQPEFTATASNIGYGWWSHDIGGHMGGSRDDELVTRWVQLGVFSPIMRLHAANNRWSSKEPWLYRKESELVISNFLRYRHRLVPYIYSAAAPLVQPMYWDFPTREEAYSVPNQYFFSELIVAPIVKPRSKRTNLASVKAWLPDRCVDVFTGTVYDGGELELYRRLSEIPVLAREGSIVPLDVNPTNGCLKPDAFEILVVVGKDGSFTLKEDDKTSAITFEQKIGRLVSNIDRPCTFRFLAITSKPAGLKLPSGAETSFETYPDVPSMLVTVSGPATIELGADPQLSAIDQTARIQAILLDYQTAFALKEKIWDAATEDASVSVRLRKLMALGDGEATGPVAELLLAVGDGKA